MKFLERPIVLGKPRSEPVEHIGMGRLLARDAKVVRRAYQAVAAKMLLPDAVDQDPGSERIAIIRNPSSQGASATRGFAWNGVQIE